MATEKLEPKVRKNLSTSVTIGVTTQAETYGPAEHVATAEFSFKQEGTLEEARVALRIKVRQAFQEVDDRLVQLFNAEGGHTSEEEGEVV